MKTKAITAIMIVLFLASAAIAHADETHIITGPVDATVERTDGYDAITFSIVITSTGAHYGVGMAFATSTDASNNEPSFQAWYREYEMPYGWYYQDWTGTGWHGWGGAVIPLIDKAGEGFSASGDHTGPTFTITVPTTALGGPGATYYYGIQVRTLSLNHYPSNFGWTSHETLGIAASYHSATVPMPPPSEVWVNVGWAGYSPGDLVDGHTFGYDAFDIIKDGINAAAPSGTVHVYSGTYVEIGQIVIGKDLTIIGESASTTIIKPSADTGSTGDARGWFLVQNGVTFYLREVTLDGSGHKVFQAVRHRGQGEVSNCIITKIKFGESGPNYAGFGIVAFGDPGNVDVTDCEFSEIGRVGVLYFGSGITDSTFSGNEYTGKGVGDWLDYAVEVGAGAHVTITGNTISNNLGVASVDGSTSAGILVTTYYGSGSVAVITYNTISGCTDGIAVGYDNADTSAVTAHYNNIFGNAMGIGSTAPTVDAEYNWWGNLNGPYDPVGTVEMPYEPEPSVSEMKNTEPVGDLGDEVSEYVDYYPWLGAPFEVYTTLEDLKTEIKDLSDDQFRPPAANRKAALIDKINEVIAKIDAGDYQGAIMKLSEDIRPKLDSNAKQSWLVEDHPELLDKIGTMVGILQGML